MIEYIAFNAGRKPEYQLQTTVRRLEDGRRLVCKQAATAAAADHLARMRAVFDGDTPDSGAFRYLRPIDDGDLLCFPYVDGLTFSQSLSADAEDASWDRVREGIAGLARTYLDAYAAMAQPFQRTEAFVFWFGEPPSEDILAERWQALPRTNIDLALDNLIPQDQGYVVIDPEWVFDFPIPLRYPLFRLILRFWQEALADSSSVAPGLSELLEEASIDAAEAAVFQGMEAAFTARVFDQPMALQPVRSIYDWVSRHAGGSRLYYGQPESEERSLYHALADGINRWQADMPEPVRRLRFDPMDEAGLVELVEVRAHAPDGRPIELSVESPAAWSDGSRFMFDKPDPRLYLISNNEAPIASVVLMYRIALRDEPILAGLAQAFETTRKKAAEDLQATRKRYRALRDELAQVRSNLEEARRTSETDARRYRELEDYQRRTAEHVGKLEDVIREQHAHIAALQAEQERRSLRRLPRRIYGRLRRSKPGKAAALLLRRGPRPFWNRLTRRSAGPEFAAVPDPEPDTALLAEMNVRISVIMPVYNVDPVWLNAAVDSVLAQKYPNWQLCLIDDASPRAETIEALSVIARRGDPRILLHRQLRNGGISAATNAGVALADGDYIALMDHDDVYHPMALYELARAIHLSEHGAPPWPMNGGGAPDVLYTDEDKLAADGSHRFPFYKPDWSPDLLRAQMYFGHILCFRKELFLEAGGMRSAFDGSQDYDLALRLSERTARIMHIPELLYSWREIAGSTAADPSAKPYAHTAGLKALDAHLKRVFGPDAYAAETEHSFVYEPVYPVRPDQRRVSIIIPFRDRSELTDACLNSIFRRTVDLADSMEIILIDNGSVDPATLRWMSSIEARDPRIRLLHDPSPFNWSRLNNLGARQASGSTLVFLNNDTLVESPDWLFKLAGHVLRPDVGTAGPLLLYEDGTIQHAGIVIGIGGWADHIYKGMEPRHFGTPFVSPAVPRNVSAVTGACLAISAAHFRELGGFDEAFQICGSDVALSIAATRRGWHNVYLPQVRLYHLESKSRDAYIPEVDFQRSYECYRPYREHGDPFFSPNLSYQTTTPTPATTTQTPAAAAQTPTATVQTSTDGED